MSVKTCKQHANEPIFIYAQCAACEIQRYRNQVDELKAECARSAEREILQLAESEALSKDAERYRHLRECNSSSLCVMQFDHHVLLESDADEAIDAAMVRGEQS